MLFCSVAVYGATVIESIDDDGKIGKVTIEKDRARIDSGALGGYILVNLKDASIYAIDHKERAILDLRSPLLTSGAMHGQADKPGTRPSVTFKKIGPGPVISGYKTIHYRVSVDGMHCSDEYLSAQLLTLPGVRRFTEVLGKATGDDRQSGMGIPYDPEAPCESADDLTDDYYPQLGIPMKSVGSNGLMTHKITRVITAFDPPVGTFTSPPSYQKMTRAQLEERAAARIPAHNQGPGNLDDAALKEFQQQIKRQIEAIKKRRHKAATGDESNEQTDSDNSADASAPATAAPSDAGQ